jgi:hypothetical protein
VKDFLIIWAFLVLNYYLGYRHRGWVEARKAAARQPWCPEDMPLAFKQWLADYIAVNTPRRD